MILYLNRGVIEDLRISKEIDDWFQQRAPGVLIMERPSLEQFQKENKIGKKVDEMFTIKGYDLYSKGFYTKGEAAELVAIKRAEN